MGLQHGVLGYNRPNCFWFTYVQEWKSCSVGCQFGFNPSKKPDAAFGLAHQTGTASVLRSMESAQYYAENNLAYARRWVSTNKYGLIAFLEEFIFSVLTCNPILI